MTPLASAISRALIHFVWQGSIVGLLLWMTLFAFRNKSAKARYFISCAALALLALTPLATVWISYSSATASAASPAVGGATGVAVLDSGVRAVSRMLWLGWVQSWALPLWSAGVVAFSLRLVLGYTHTFQLRRRAKPAAEHVVAVVGRLKRAMGVGRAIRVMISAMSDSPSVVGWVRPVILLPAATLMGLTALQLEAILAHEIGHIKRYDYLVNIVQMLVETLLFYHPVVWWTSRKIRIERELCCDDLAVRFSGNALRYARALTVLEKLRLRTPGMAMASTGGPLLYRIQRLVGVDAKDYAPSRLPTVLAMGLGVLCMTLNVTWIRAQDAPGVKVDLGAASVIHRSPVRYPEEAEKRGITGTVQVEVTLDAAGNVADAHVLSGPEELRKSALESVLNWHFTAEAARSTRLISISYSGEGKQVQVREPVSGVFNGIAVTYDGSTRENFKVIAEPAGQLTLRQELERAIGALQRKMKEAEGTASPEARKEMEAKLDDLKAKFQAAPLPAQAARGGFAAGRTLKGIAIFGFSDDVRNELTAQLPVRIGDTLSPTSIEQTAAAVRNFDEHLRVQVLLTDDGQAELRISAPEARR